MMDSTSPEPYNFNPDRMRLVLRCLYPEPRCFLVGEGVELEDNAAAVEVWKEFVAERKVESPLLINFREFEDRTLEETIATPKEKLLAEVIKTRMMPHFFGQRE
ncbi:hypothetical protein PMZ80_007042 [Knufia obscura]|uniref:Uncharacterized protein n=2 Tax=Knufia TaxID=430999 RepID=A0AAN8F846_9EURO|nr:hypothetical protein PMZ80_007042 [Knufia obscura]KAK5953051.1 hypothetical protein OHC33_005619 [Knufia fluminis]